MEAIKKEQIYLDLSKLSGEEIKEAYSVLNNSYDDVSKSLNDMFKIGNHIKDIPLMSYNPYSESWMLYKKVVGKAEINLSEFRQLFSKGEEVLQVEINPSLKYSFTYIKETLQMCLNDGNFEDMETIYNSVNNSINALEEIENLIKSNN